MLHAVIMAGGVGTRFWPLSRARSPKQFLRFLEPQSMIQKTVERMQGRIPPERILVVTRADQADECRRQLPSLPSENILVEPIGRNTAPCIGLAAIHIHRRDPEAVMAVLAADHLIEPADAFMNSLTFGNHLALERRLLVTMGIPPSRPETGYGYIQYFADDKVEFAGLTASRVKTFAEKPNLATAQRFLESGDFLWNSGMFVWRVEDILTLMEEFLPETYQGLMEIATAIGTPEYDPALNRCYPLFRSISIDYGIMEKAKNVYVIRAPFQWNDVGSWEEIYLISPKDGQGNAVVGNTVLRETHHSLIYSPKKWVAAIGVENLIVVETDDALLIARRDRSQEVKHIVDELSSRDQTHLL